MSDRKWNVAVVGALGMVGTQMIKTLEMRDFPVAELRPLDLADLEGTEVDFTGRKVRTLAATAENFAGVEIAIFSAGAAASLELAPLAVEKGAVVVDNSSAWRMNPECPLVVPEVNPHDLQWHKGIIANPNCSTIQMVVALKPLHDRARIKRVVVSTYQAASGAGRLAFEELGQQTRDLLEGNPANPQAFSHQIAFNVIPQIDVFQEGDYTKEESKMVKETQKIMGDDSIKVTATCVRVPVFFGHSEAVNIETEQKLSADEARDLLRSAPGVRVIDDPAELRYPMPVDAAYTDDVFVGRIREDFTVENGLNLWIVADNIRKGAALNTVQIAEQMVVDDLVKVP
ncbi:MAG: aspartate-semialdehyde dehydrogenase [Chloroflexi bacterium B3_Chlor]|nr:MAG: aspartate-semialdehyde dehydrogenase [Chloroflexi bacterium B3_Chlor]